MHNMIGILLDFCWNICKNKRAWDAPAVCSYVLLCVPLSVCLDIFEYFYMFRDVEGLYQKLSELYTLRSKYEGHVLAREWLWQHVRRSRNLSSAIHCIGMPTGRTEQRIVAVVK